jgi:hypothetical protein
MIWQVVLQEPIPGPDGRELPAGTICFVRSYSRSGYLHVFVDLDDVRWFFAVPRSKVKSEPDHG